MKTKFVKERRQELVAVVVEERTEFRRDYLLTETKQENK